MSSLSGSIHINNSEFNKKPSKDSNKINVVNELKIDSNPMSMNSNMEVNQQNYPGFWKTKHQKLPKTYINIHHDPRVVKGNTYAAFVIPSSLQLEFLRLKEEEERRIRVMKQSNNLPRVAKLGLLKGKKQKTDEGGIKREEIPTYNVVDEEQNEDDPYYFIDKAPTPKYIPLPPGREIGTQIDDLELFDYELEVEPILQVLVGRTLVLSQYELIEEDERSIYLEETRIHAQNREFELVKLQREEAARIRRDKEIDRRNLQKKERVQRDKLTQKKIYARVFARNYLRNIQCNTMRLLTSNGVFTGKTAMKLTDLLNEKFLPVAGKLSIRSEVNAVLMERFKASFFSKEKAKHKLLLEQVFQERQENREKEVKEQEEKRVNDAEALRLKNERKEARRVEKFTKIVEDTVLKTKYDKTDVSLVPIADIDDLTQVSSAIHTVGGQFGEFVLCVQALLEELVYKFASIKKVVVNSNNINNEDMDIVNMEEPVKEKEKDVIPVNNNNNNSNLDNDNNQDNQPEKPKLLLTDIIKPQLTPYNKKSKELDIEQFIRDLVRRFLLGLKDNEFFTIKYLESARFDFTALPEEDVKRLEYRNFLVDKRRFHNKSVKTLLENSVLETKLFELVLDELSLIYTAKNVDVNSPEVQLVINPDPGNGSPEYLAKVKEYSDTIALQNTTNDKMRKKIKISLIKPEVLKKKKDNVIALVRVFPVEDTYEAYNEELVEEEEEEAEAVEVEAVKEREDDGKAVTEDNAEGDRVKDDDGKGDRGNDKEGDMEVDGDNTYDREKEEKELKEKEETSKLKDDSNKNKAENKNQKSYEEVKEPRFTSFEYLNKVQLLRNVNVVGDCFISHRNATDHYKITVLRNITQQFRRYYKPYKAILDEERRIIREREEEELRKQRAVQEAEDLKKAQEEEEERKKREEEEAKKEENNDDKSKNNLSKKPTSNVITNKNKDKDGKDGKDGKDKDKKESKDNKEKDKKKEEKSFIDPNTSVLGKDKGKANQNTTSFGVTGKTTNLNVENKILEDDNDEYCSKSLLDLIKPRFNHYQEQLENIILSNEKFWSKNRKKHYKIIPIDVLPPQPEEPADQ